MQLCMFLEDTKFPFHKSCTILYSFHECIRIPVIKQVDHLNKLLNFHSWEVTSWYSFNLQLSSYEPCCVTFHMFKINFQLFSYEISMHIFLMFSIDCWSIPPKFLRTICILEIVPLCLWYKLQTYFPTLSFVFWLFFDCGGSLFLPCKKICFSLSLMQLHWPVF